MGKIRGKGKKLYILEKKSKQYIATTKDNFF